MTPFSTYSSWRRPIPVLPPADSLPFPGCAIRLCESCNLHAGCTAPVPGDGSIPADVMLVGQNPGCFPSGTYVSTPDGVKDIASIQVGDMVLGEQGQAQRVTAVFSRTTDSLVRLKARKSLPVEMTPNHPILVVSPQKCYDSHTRVYCFPCSSRSCRRKYYSGYKTEWKAAQDVKVGDHVVVPMPHSNDLDNAASPNNHGIVRVPFPQRGEFRQTFKFRRSTGKKYPRKGFRLGRGLAYALGWYMADGYANVENGVVGLSVGKNKYKYTLLIAQQFWRVFRIGGEWSPEKASVRRFAVYSRALAAWFIALFGRDAASKRVPAPIFWCDRRIIKSFITGWYRGDGRHKKSGKNDGIVTASLEAALGLRDLLLRIGVVPTIHKEIWHGFAGDRSKTGEGYVVEFPISFAWERDTAAIDFGGNRLLCVDSVEWIDRKCSVFNIGTEDNRYIVPFVVHNSNEDQYGKPFIGMAGKYLDSLLFQAGIPRESVYITNLVHCLTSNNRELRPDEIAACSKWLALELELVNPRIVVAMGAPAIAYFLGKGAGTVEHLHGKPVERDGRIILPAYHPAAALRNTTLLRQCSDDFQVLRGLAKGRDWREYHVQDAYPNPVYRVVDTPEKMLGMVIAIEQAGEYAVDTEICRGKLWSVQISCKPGEAYFIPVADDFKGRVDLTKINATAIVHNYLFDIQYVNLSDDRFVDTMTMAYLVGLPQGLKELASRLCGIQMINYNEVVRPGQQKLALTYLRDAIGREWPDPPAIEETKWDNKRGELITKAKKPWHISRKMSNILTDFDKSGDTDLWGRWRKIPDEERFVVESVLGPMPESSLADITFDQAVQYASRDADATLRVYHKLKEMITDSELDFIQYLDLGVLPQVYEMMQNGMPVDIPYLNELSRYYAGNMEVAAGLASAKIGHPFNPSSSKQVADVVYSELGFKPTKKTATGLISTDDQELKKVKHPVIADILEYRRNLKNKSTFADALAENAVPHQQGKDTVYRVHTTLKTTRTETGRLSSADPINLQTMPTRSEDGRKIRRGFKASPGYKLLAGDFSQQELRLQAHEAKCENMLKLFRAGIDFHTATAAMIFDVPMDEAVKTQYRYPSKVANFEIIYLVSPEGLCESIHEQAMDIIVDGKPLDVSQWTIDSCGDLINRWYKVNWEVKDWQMEKIAEARRFGYVTDIFGRRRYVPEITCPIRNIQESGARMCVNFPIQGGCASITKLAMLESYQSRNRLYSPDDVRFLMAIHDELMLEVKEDMVMDIAVWLKGIMDNVVVLDIPMVAEIKVGDNWAGMEKLKL